MNRPPAWLPGIDPIERARRLRARLRERKKPPRTDPRQLVLFSNLPISDPAEAGPKGQTK